MMKFRKSVHDLELLYCTVAVRDVSWWKLASMILCSARVLRVMQ